MTKEFEDNGLILVMSEDDPAKTKRKLLGVSLGGEEGEIRPPEQFLQEVAYTRNKGRVRVWEFDKTMGKCAWMFPLHRFFEASYTIVTTYWSFSVRDLPKEELQKIM